MRGGVQNSYLWIFPKLTLKSHDQMNQGIGIQDIEVAGYKVPSQEHIFSLVDLTL
jgi:hypothetical protein